MPVIKRISSKSGANLQAREAYIRDAKHAKNGELAGSKVDFCLALGGTTSDWTATVKEMVALESCIETDGAKSEHWIMSLKKGETWTPETAQEAALITQRHLGYEGPILIAAHKDSDNSHLHLAFSRIRETEAGGYELAYTGGSDSHTTSGHTYAHMSAARAEAEIRARQGWTREKKAKFDFVGNQYIKAKYKKTPIDNNKVKLGSRVEAYEAHQGKPYPKRLLATTAVEAIRASANNREIAIKLLAEKGLTYIENEKGAKIISADVKNGVKLSALPNDCRFLRNTDVPKIANDLPPQIDSYSDTKSFIKQVLREKIDEQTFNQKLQEKGLAFEQTGKTGGRIRFAPGATGTVKLSECGTSFLQLQKMFNPTPLLENISNNIATVNVSSKNVHGTTNTDAVNKQQKTIYDIAPAILAQVKTKQEKTEMLAAQGITFTVEKGTDAKTGKEFSYGKLVKPGENPISLRQLGLDTEGKPLFSLNNIERMHIQAERIALALDAARIFDSCSSYQEAEQTLLAQHITYKRERIMVKDNKGEDREITVAKLERDGITTTAGSAGRAYQPAHLDARFLPYNDAKNLYESIRTSPTPVQDLAAKGYTASDIDRVGRVGDKAEKAIQRREKDKIKTPQKAMVTPPPVKSVIPTDINEILNLIEESSKHAAQVAKANAQAAQANILANRAEHRAAQAENALQQLKDSLKTEEKVMDTPTATPTIEKPMGMAERIKRAKEEGAFSHTAQPLSTNNNTDPNQQNQNQQHQHKADSTCKCNTLKVE